jgi:hypothetical protein
MDYQEALVGTAATEVATKQIIMFPKVHPRKT